MYENGTIYVQRKILTKIYDISLWQSLIIVCISVFGSHFFAISRICITEYVYIRIRKVPSVVRTTYIYVVRRNANYVYIRSKLILPFYS